MTERRTAAPAKPLDQLDELVRRLAKNPPRVVAATHAPAARTEEPFLLDWVGRRCTEAAAARRAETMLFDAGAPGFDPGGLYAALTTRSLFSPESAWVVRQADALVRGSRGGGDDEAGDDAADAEGDASSEPRAKRSAEAGSTPFERAVLAFAAAPPSGDQLILLARRLRAPFVRALREADALVLELRPLYDKPFQGSGPVDSTELGEFMRRLARDAGFAFGPGALTALASRTGSSLSMIASALAKLKALVAEKELQVAHILQHVPVSRAGSPWALAEAIVSGDAARALGELAYLSASGARDGEGKTIAADGAYAMALAAVVRDARRNAAAARMMAGGASVDDAAAALGVPRFPAAMDAFRAAMQGRTPDEHRRFLEAAAQAEIAMRRRGEKPRSALARLAVRGRRRAAVRRGAGK